MLKLDKKKPYGVVVGHELYKYEQNGHYYDINLNILLIPSIQVETKEKTLGPLRQSGVFDENFKEVVDVDVGAVPSFLNKDKYKGKLE